MFGSDYEAMKARISSPLAHVQEHTRAVRRAKTGTDGEVDVTFHTWLWKDLDNATEAAMRRIQAEISQFLGTHHSRVATPLESMDELYVSAVQHTEGSDKVFVTPHMDGFFQWLPLASVKRCIYGVDVLSKGGPDVTTVRPFHPVQSQQQVVVRSGDAVCFDYNHDLHWIAQDQSSGQCSSTNETGCGAGGVRVVLKYHFLEMPKALSKLGPVAEELNSRYNAFARKLFVTSLKPSEGLVATFVGHLINAVTRISYVEYYFGGFNMLRVFFLILASNFTPSRLMPTLGVAHYYLYILVFIFRSIPLEVFIRDAFFVKSSAMCVIALCYFSFRPNFLSILVSAAGFGLSAAAFVALGSEATYFGWQYGRQVKMVEDWPYGEGMGFRIPHPMILGSAIGLCGLCINSGFRKAYGRCILAHLALYGVVLALEVTDTHVPAALSYSTLFEEFHSFHKNTMNVWAHLFTTGVGFLGALGLLRAVAEKAGWKSAEAVYGAVFVGLLVQSTAVYYHDPDVASLSGLLLMTLGFLAVALRMSFWESLLAIVVGTGLQEASHFAVQEPAYMWSYFDGSGAAWAKLGLHTLHLCAFNIKALFVPEAKAFEGDARTMALFGLLAVSAWLVVAIPYRQCCRK